MSNYRFSIPFRYLETILAFAGTDARFSRHGFLAEPSAEYLRLIATDGNRMAILSIPAEKAQGWYMDAPSIPGHDVSEYLAEPLFVPAPERLSALKPPRNITMPILAHVSIEEGFFAGGGTLPPTMVPWPWFDHAEFPNWRKVWETTNFAESPKCLQTPFDPSGFAETLKAIARFAGNEDIAYFLPNQNGLPWGLWALDPETQSTLAVYQSPLLSESQNSWPPSVVELFRVATTPPPQVTQPNDTIAAD
jgi:hypothetical protein